MTNLTHTETSSTVRKSRGLWVKKCSNTWTKTFRNLAWYRKFWVPIRYLSHLGSRALGNRNQGRGFQGQLLIVWERPLPRMDRNWSTLTINIPKGAGEPVESAVATNRQQSQHQAKTLGVETAQNFKPNITLTKCQGSCNQRAHLFNDLSLLFFILFVKQSIILFQN